MIENITISRASESHFSAIWEIFQSVVQSGDAFAYSSDTTQDQVRKLWMGEHSHSFVALANGDVCGTSYIKPNQPGQGSHVANAGFMVAPKFRGLGLGRKLGLHALQQAYLLGFKAMQFNYVVSTNEPAVALWKQLGFNVIGTIPEGFFHPGLGFVDVFIMHRFLGGALLPTS